jgi:ApaG protein
MVTQITSNIKISVITNYEGIYYKEYQMLYAFSYQITIENLSSDVVQLQARHWEIFDTLNHTETVDGEGVVGQTPILPPGKKYVYSSGCMLKGAIGAMNGFYTMANFSNNTFFKVQIPTFKLVVPFAIN